MYVCQVKYYLLLTHKDPMATLLPADWKLSLFGGTRLQIKDGQTLSLPPGRTTALLACLALAPDFTVNRSRLAEMLWPEQPLETSRNRLKQTLYVLRQEIERAGFSPETLLIGGRADIRLNPESVEVDTATFVKLLKMAGQEPDPALREIVLAKASRLYQGELLPDFYEEWVIEDRRSLDNQYQKALNELIEVRETLGNLEGALTTARRLAEISPYMEGAHLAVMRLCAALGQPAAAVRQYRLLEQVLQEELQMAPSAQATALLAQIQKQAAPPQVASPFQKQTAVPLPLSPQDASPQEASTLPVSVNLATFAQETVPVWRPRPRKRLALLALALLLLLAGGLFYRQRLSAVRSSDGKILWVTHDTPLPDEADFEPIAIATDARGNTFVTGYVQTKKNDIDILTLKFDPDGKLRWHQRYNGPGNDCDRPSALVVDAEGSVSVAGESYTPKGKQEPEGWHPVLLRYAPDGRLLWKRRLPEVLERHEKSVLLVSDGGTGLWMAANVLQKGHADILLLNFSSTGVRQSVPLRLPEIESRVVNGLTADKYSVWIVGSAFQPIIKGYGYDTDWLIARYINTFGFPLEWHQFLEGKGNRNDSASGVAADAHGNVFVTGLTDEGDAANGGTGMNVTTAKYDERGNLLWTDRHPAPATVIKGIAVDREGSPSVTGRIEEDVLTMRYTPDVKRLWAHTYDGTGARMDEGNAIATLPDGRVAVVGTTYSGSIVRGGTGFDALILLYDPSGKLLWRRIHDEGGHAEHGCVLTTDPSGNLLVAAQAGQHRLALLKILP
jgi:DNA-binding SARP family transcriptional activator